MARETLPVEVHPRNQLVADDLPTTVSGTVQRFELLQRRRRQVDGAIRRHMSPYDSIRWNGGLQGASSFVNA